MREWIRSSILRLVSDSLCGVCNLADGSVADVEAEDLDLGIDDDHLAEDVDEGMAEDDPEALDSDDEEETRENESLGIFDMEETEGEFFIKA